LEAGVSLEISESALEILARDGYSEAYGARALRRYMEDNLVAPVSRILGKTGGDARGGTVRVGASARANGQQAKPSSSDGHALGPQIASLDHGELRFELHRARDTRARRFELELERVQQLREHIAFVLSQLNYAPEGDAAKADRRSSHEIAALQTEHHRLSALWRKGEKLHEDLLTAEELALTALFEGEDTREGVARSDHDHHAGARRGARVRLVARRALAQHGVARVGRGGVLRRRQSAADRVDLAGHVAGVPPLRAAAHRAARAGAPRRQGAQGELAVLGRACCSRSRRACTGTSRCIPR
jgi:ATP-dependent Clp protease ATP-binding subunit ClpC